MTILIHTHITILKRYSRFVPLGPHLKRMCVRGGGEVKGGRRKRTALFRKYKALLRDCKAVFGEDRALLRKDKAVFKKGYGSFERR